MLICSMLKNNYSGHQLEAGTDEAGRGCLSGPVVAAAVILPPDFYHKLLNDSNVSFTISSSPFPFFAISKLFLFYHLKLCHGVNRPFRVYFSMEQ